MKYSSVCSGIEAPTMAWHGLGWEPVWFSQFDPEHNYNKGLDFASEVLKYHYPNVPNLGDMTKLHSNEVYHESRFDLLVGGTPCQSYSIAGLRNSDDDSRGALIYTFLDIVEKNRPQFVVWENVPGFLSAKNDVFQKLIQGFNRLQYAVDFDILDAQHFGVPQRRKRVFLICQDVKLGREMRTSLFLKTVLQCLIDLSLKSLIGQLSRLGIEGLDSLLPSTISEDGLLTRTRLLGLIEIGSQSTSTTNLSLEKFLKDLEETILRHVVEFGNLELILEGPKEGGESIGVGRLSELVTDFHYLDILKLWKELLEDLLLEEKSPTISTGISQTTLQRICYSVKILLSTLRFTHNFSNLQNHLLTSALSDLTKIERSMNYVLQYIRKKDFGVEGCSNYSNNFQSTLRDIRDSIIRYSGDRECSSAVLFESKSLSGDSKQSSKKGEETPDSIGGGVKGFDMRGFGDYGGGELSSTLKKRGGKDATTDLVVEPMAYAYSKSHRANGNVDVRFTEDGKSNTLTCGDGCGNQSTLNIVAQPIVFDTTQITNPNNRSTIEEGKPSHSLSKFQHPPAIANCYGVRRLTPEECEQLQGFPKGFTKIPWKGKKETPNTLRYAAVGNSMAVPVMKWIGERIAKVDAIEKSGIEFPKRWARMLL